LTPFFPFSQSIASALFFSGLFVFTLQRISKWVYPIDTRLGPC
jgi:hypothetical protein